MTSFSKFSSHISYVLEHSSTQVVDSVRSYLEKQQENGVDADWIKAEVLSAILDKAVNCELVTQRFAVTEPTLTLEQERNFEIVCNDFIPYVVLKNCENFILNLTNLKSIMLTGKRAKFLLQLENCNNFQIVGGDITNARHFCILENCQFFSIDDVSLVRTEGYGFILFDCQFFKIHGCQSRYGLASAVYCLGSTRYGVIEHNIFTNGTGYINCDAALHIAHCTPDLNVEDIPDRSHEDCEITKKSKKPHYLLIQNNIFSKNRAQGIYCEGCFLSVFENNLIEGNNKEGICFDWGSSLNCFRVNVLTYNGERAALTATEVDADFIGHYTPLTDGSSPSKLPGISIDNGALNFISKNKIFMNFGDGIKMVRTAVGNIVTQNVIYENGIGTNQYFNFHGIVLSGTGAGDLEFVSNQAKLDFKPSEYNHIDSNILGGRGQYFGIYMAPGSEKNSVYSNNVFRGCRISVVPDSLEIIKV